MADAYLMTYTTSGGAGSGTTSSQVNVSCGAAKVYYAQAPTVSILQSPQFYQQQQRTVYQQQQQPVYQQDVRPVYPASGSLSRQMQKPGSKEMRMSSGVGGPISTSGLSQPGRTSDYTFDYKTSDYALNSSEYTYVDSF
jgi:hypothetical protein